LGRLVELGVLLFLGVAVVEQDALAAGVEAQNGLLGLEFAELDAGVFAGCGVELAGVDRIGERLAGLFLIACGKP
jgi:hypothetical protein